MGRPVTPEEIAYLVVIVIPLTLVWVLAVVDLVRQPHLSTRAKWLWLLSFSLIWPLLVVYLLSRPVQGRLERSGTRDYPQARLVDAALAHEGGRIGNQEMASLVRELRGT